YAELFEAVRGLGEHTRLVVVGGHDPEKSDALSPAVLGAAESERVVLLGQREDVDELYAAMDVFALASYREGFPRSAMEAAAMGLPIVATDIRGCRQVVDDGENGLLVPARDAGALHSALRRLVEDPGLRRRFGTAGRHRAAQRFDERRCVEIVLDTYAEVLERRRPDAGRGLRGAR
ncbi:MAG TPA: glycosyltransferase, partial [Acidimicrobiia bacterium]